MQGEDFSVEAARLRREDRRRARRHARRRAVKALALSTLAVCLLGLGWLTPLPATPGAGEADQADWIGLTLRKGPPAAPGPLQIHLENLALAFPGRAGIAVRDVSADWTAGVDLESPYPQQSVSKLWVALSVLDAVDRGELRLDDTVLVRREDLSIFHQPLREKVGRGTYRTQVMALLENSTTLSDNAANDVLMRLVGGPDRVRAVMGEKALDGIGFGDEERFFQTAIAGLDWRPDFSFGQSFWRARESMPQGRRLAALEAYLADPPDGATPGAVTAALDRLASGELLGADATEQLLTLMAASRTGPKRLGGGLTEGWSLAHKTGTGQVMGARATGYNDVGLLTAPDGRVYAVAVMIAETTAAVPERQALMQAVTRAVIDHHAGRDPGAAPPDDFQFIPGDQLTAALDLRPAARP